MKINKPISSIITFVIILMMVFLFLIPTYQKMNDLQNSLVQKQAEYDGKFVYYTKIASILKEIDSRKDAMEKIDSALPSDSYFSPLVYFFHKEAVLTGLTATSVRLSQITPPNKKTKIRNIVFNLQLSGTYENFKKFLASLDTSARLFEVNSVSFSTPTTPLQGRLPQASRTYNFDVEIQTHAY